MTEIPPVPGHRMPETPWSQMRVHYVSMDKRWYASAARTRKDGSWVCAEGDGETREEAVRECAERIVADDLRGSDL